MVSAADRAKRALVALLKRLAAKYAVTLSILRDTPDAGVARAYRKVSLRHTSTTVASHKTRQT